MFWRYIRLIKRLNPLKKTFPGVAEGVYERREHEGEGLQEGGVHQEGGSQVLTHFIPGLRIRIQVFRSDPDPDPGASLGSGSGFQNKVRSKL